MSESVLVLVTKIILAFALGLQLTEELQFSHVLRGSPFPNSVTRRMQSIAFLQLLLLGGLFWPWGSLSAVSVSGLLLALQILRLGAWRGTLAGASDMMTTTILIGLVCSAFSSRVGLTWIGAQMLLSYLIAGVSKLRQSDWRSGQALLTILAQRQVAGLFLPKISVAQSRVLSWSLILWEMSLPFSLPWSKWLCANLVLAIGFHLTVAMLFGLSRFFWIWLAGWPGLFWIGQTLAGGQ